MKDKLKSERKASITDASSNGLPDAEFRLDLIFPTQQQDDAPCSANCPAGGSIRQWIGLVAQRNKLGLTTTEAYKQAWELLVDRNPFPATMGRICPHPCESGCNRVEKDGAVAVNEMERFLGDWGISEGLALPKLAQTAQKERIGVIGAGPAGLSFAYQMARRGYEVTVYDRHSDAGGMLRYGIPDYRLPPHVLDAEIRRIRDLGVKFELGVRVGADIEIDTLLKGYDVLFVGIGAQIGRRLGIQGEEGEGVWTGTDYLHRINLGQNVPLGDKVIVIGGGNTAVDAARTAKRHGAEVTLLYRRTREEMPAISEEVNEAIEEGVSVELLAAPVEIVRSGDRVAAVNIQRMRLGEPDESGRKRPVPVPGDVFALPASSVISAVSQAVDWAHLEALRERGAWVVTATEPGINPLLLSGGDLLGLGIASQAIGQGRGAAEATHARLRGLPDGQAEGASVARSPKLDLYASSPRVAVDRLPVPTRLEHPEMEISASISEDQFLREAERCLSCGSCFGCQHCWMYCNAGGFSEVDQQEPGRYFALDLSVCEGCGKCIEVCPSGFLAPGPPPRS